MRKRTCIIFFVLAGTTAIFAADFSVSAGGGVYVGGLFTRYTLNADGRIGSNAVDVEAIQEMNQFNYGAFLFADATWVILCVGIQGGINNYKENIIFDSEGGIKSLTSGLGSETMLVLGLLGKYPFRLSERLTIFPMAGLEYQIALTQHREPEGRTSYNRTDGIRETDVNGNPYKLSTWNSLFVDIGAGLDFSFSSSLYLRTELLYGFRLRTPYELDALEKTKTAVNAPNPKLNGLTSGPTLRVSAGWRFF